MVRTRYICTTYLCCLKKLPPLQYPTVWQTPKKDLTTIIERKDKSLISTNSWWYCSLSKLSSKTLALNMAKFLQQFKLSRVYCIYCSDGSCSCLNNNTGIVQVHWVFLWGCQRHIPYFYLFSKSVNQTRAHKWLLLSNGYSCVLLTKLQKRYVVSNFFMVKNYLWYASNSLYVYTVRATPCKNGCFILRKDFFASILPLSHSYINFFFSFMSNISKQFPFYSSKLKLKLI